MKIVVLAGLVVAVGCATMASQPISAVQARQFRQTIAKAEVNGRSDLNPEAAARLRAAQSDFYYAEHSPSNPDRAREMARKAQDEADQALSLIQQNRKDLALSGTDTY